MVQEGDWNIGSMNGRGEKLAELAEVLRKKVDVCFVQKVRYRRESTTIVVGRNDKFKLYWLSNDKDLSGVTVAKKWITEVTNVVRVSDRITVLKLIVGKRVPREVVKWVMKKLGNEEW